MIRARRRGGNRAALRNILRGIIALPAPEMYTTEYKLHGAGFIEMKSLLWRVQFAVAVLKFMTGNGQREKWGREIEKSQIA